MDGSAFSAGLATVNEAGREQTFEEWQAQFSEDGEIGTSVYLDPDAVQTVVETCIMVQYTIIFGIVIFLSYVLYKLLRIFF